MENEKYKPIILNISVLVWYNKKVVTKTSHELFMDDGLMRKIQTIEEFKNGKHCIYTMETRVLDRETGKYISEQKENITKAIYHKLKDLWEALPVNDSYTSGKGTSSHQTRYLA